MHSGRGDEYSAWLDALAVRVFRRQDSGALEDFREVTRRSHVHHDQDASAKSWTEFAGNLGERLKPARRGADHHDGKRSGRF